MKYSVPPLPKIRPLHSVKNMNFP